MQNVQMVVVGQFENAEKSRETINLAARYFKKHGLKLIQCSDTPGVSQKDVEEAKVLVQRAQTVEQQMEQAVETNNVNT